jgi:hypothetical protein
MARIARAQRSARERAAAIISGMDNLQAAAIHTGVGKLVHKYDAFVVQAPDDHITVSDIFQVCYG